jgi:hypothetical protein
MQGMRETNQGYATLAEILLNAMPCEQLDEVPPTSCRCRYTTNKSYFISRLKPEYDQILKLARSAMEFSLKAYNKGGFQ